MKQLIILFSFVVLLSSCRDSSTIENNPVVEQININVNAKYKYSVKLNTSDISDAYMLTDFRYQVGDTLISYFEYFETRLKPTQDSLKLYKEKTAILEKENISLKTYIKFLQDKSPSIELK